MRCGKENIPEALICQHCGAVLIEEADDGQEHVRRAELYEKEGKIIAAIEEYRKAIKLLPSWPDLHYRLGLLYERQSERETTTHFSDLALEEFRQAIRLEPSKDCYHGKFINLCLKKDLLAQAAQEFRSLLEKTPANREIEESLKKIHALSQFQFTPSTVTPSRGPNIRALNPRTLLVLIIVGIMVYGFISNQRTHLIVGITLFFSFIIYQYWRLRKKG